MSWNIGGACGNGGFGECPICGLDKGGLVKGRPYEGGLGKGGLSTGGLGKGRLSTGGVGKGRLSTGGLGKGGLGRGCVGGIGIYSPSRLWRSFLNCTCVQTDILAIPVHMQYPNTKAKPMYRAVIMVM